MLHLSHPDSDSPTGVATPLAPPLFPSRGGSSRYTVQLRTLAELDNSFRQRWQELEDVSYSHNPFMSPAYVFSAVRHLQEVTPPILLTVERRGELLGICALQSHPGRRRFPIRHLSSWQTPHTYLDLPLLRSDMAEQVLQEIWNFLLRGRHEFHGIEFPRFPNGEALTRMVEGTAQASGISCVKGTCWERASLIPGDQAQTEVSAHISPRRLKSLKRGWKELEKRGTAQYEILTDPADVRGCANDLMRLESLGWKADIGTALVSQAGHERFFREMIEQQSRQGNVFFSRLTVDGQSIGSVAHLVAGSTAYAFKLGWDPQWERGCPGFQLKYHAALELANRVPGLQLVDSCSAPGSFIEHVWPHRRSFCSRIFVTSPVGQMAAAMVNGLRWVKNSAKAVSRHLFSAEEESIL